MSNDSLKLQIAGGIATITMDDGKVNAMDNDWFRLMLDMLDEVEASDATALVIRGRDGVFSGGLNIKWLPTMSPKEAIQFLQLFPATMKRVYNFSKPTVAQVTGHAIAGGCILACACDRRAAISGMNVAMNEVRVKMTIPEWAINIVLDALPGPQAKKMLKFGESVLTDDLVMWHVFDAVCDNAEDLEDTVDIILKSFEGISGPDFAGTKARVRDLLR